MKYKISIIIPILNEAQFIGQLLLYIQNNSSTKNSIEIIVVDGGSSDGSQQIVKNFITLNNSEKGEEFYGESNGDLDTKFLKKNFTLTAITLLNSKKGRAIQMNLGATFASGNILYFLHADSFPPKDFDELIKSEVEKGNNAGCFRMQFDHNHWWLRLASWLTQFGLRACRGGDQSQFITKVLFDEIGGFDESYTIYEDNILINELYAKNEFVVIQQKIKTSARLYKKHGIWKLQFYFWAIYVKKWFGASADELFTYYKKHIC